MMNKDMPRFMVLAFIDDEVNKPYFETEFFYHYEDARLSMAKWDDCNTSTDLYTWIDTGRGYRLMLFEDFLDSIIDIYDKED